MPSWLEELVLSTCVPSCKVPAHLGIFCKCRTAALIQERMVEIEVEPALVDRVDCASAQVSASDQS